jgi:tetratricopeptide (TPR) repeat protein
MTSPFSPSRTNEETYEELISLIENSQGRLAPIIVACDDWALRQRVIDRYEAEAQQANILPYRVVLGREPSVRAALAKLKDENDYLQQGGEAVFTVTGAETLLRVTLEAEDEQSELDKFFGYLQWTREGLREFRYPIVLWVTYRILKEISRRAPDFWSWRKAVLRFETETESIISTLPATPLQPNPIEPLSDNFLPPLEELQAEIQQLESTSADSPNLATLYDQLGQVYANRVRTGKAKNLEQERQAAIAAFKVAIYRYHQLDQKPAQSAVLTRLGNFLFSLSRFQEAIAPHQKSLEIEREISNQQGESVALGNLGNAYYWLGQYQQAIEFHQQNLKIARKFGDRKGESYALGNLALVYYSLGQYQQAIELHQQNLEIAREIEDQYSEASALGNLAFAYNFLGQYQQAINLFQQQLKVVCRIGDRFGEANALNGLGNAYHSLGLHQQALDLHQQALKIAHEIGNRQIESHALNGLGSAYYSLGQYKQAIDLYQLSLKIKREIGDWRGSANSLFNQAHTFAKLGQSLWGLQKLQEAKQLYAALGLNHEVEKCNAAIYKFNQIIAAEPPTFPKLRDEPHKSRLFPKQASSWVYFLIGLAIALLIAWLL